MAEAQLFELEGETLGAAASPSPQPRSSPGGSSTPTHELHNADIAVERRVVPLMEYSEDVCSICLEEYASEDPGAPTVCG
jgi:hypothetical protein